jgi:hypothetical protein
MRKLSALSLILFAGVYSTVLQATTLSAPAIVPAPRPAAAAVRATPAGECEDLLAEKEAVLADLRAGRYCTACTRTRTEFAKSQHNYEMHFDLAPGNRAKGPAPQRVIDQKARKYDDLIARKCGQPAPVNREPRPVVTASVRVLTAAPLTVNKRIQITFDITNRGDAPVTFQRLLAGGRRDGDPNCATGGCPDFPSLTSVTLKPGQSLAYTREQAFTVAGRYNFFASYLTGAGWVTNVNADAGVSNRVSVEIGGLKPLKLVASDDGDSNHPLYIRAEKTKVAESTISADVVIQNVTETWFQVEIQYDMKSESAPTYASDNSIPTVFLIPPSSQLKFRATFYEGEYLHYKISKKTLPVYSMLAADILGRGFLGVEIATPLGQFDLVKDRVLELLNEIKAGCATEAFQFGECLGRGEKLCTAKQFVELVQCTATDPKLRRVMSQLLTKLAGKKAAKKWLDLAARKGVKRAIFILTLLENGPKVAVLLDATFRANPKGHVRLEARR